MIGESLPEQNRYSKLLLNGAFFSFSVSQSLLDWPVAPLCSLVGSRPSLQLWPCGWSLSLQLSPGWLQGWISLPGALSGLGMVGQVFLGDVHITMIFRLPL